MATELDPTLTNKQFHNWLKGALALLFGKEGLTDFVKNGITEIQTNLLHSVFQKNGLPASTTCSTCTTENILACPTKGFCNGGKKCIVHNSKIQSKKPNQPCPNGLCDKIKQAIRYEHRFANPSWKNTKAQKWCSDAFELIKCYMPPDGYLYKNNLEETDFNGTIAVVYNNCYFQKKISSQLVNEPNICSRAREVGRLIRHSPDFLLSDVDLARCIDTIIDLLRDQAYLLNDPKAQEAVSKLIQLKNNTLVIQTGDLTKILDEGVRESLSKQQEDALQSMREHLCDVQSESTSAIEAIITTKHKAIEEIQNTLKLEKQKIVLEKQNPLPLSSRFPQTTSESDEPENQSTIVSNRFNDLQQDLIEFYQEYESTLLVSPLIDDFAVPLLDLYVHIPMEAHKNPHILCKVTQNKNAANISKETKKRNEKMRTRLDKDKVDIAWYEQLFFNEDNIPCTHIYISALAGKGKSSFCQYLSLVWCQAHKPDAKVKKKFRKVDLDTLKHFDIFFLIHLREYQGTNLCNIDDICTMFANNLARGTQYSKEVVQNILHAKRCLVVLDGLDEWSHPDSCRKIPGIPHNNHPNSCTTLTTTRPWKMSILGLSSKQIDRYIEMKELNFETSRKLEEKALKVLNKTNKSYSPYEDALNFENEIKKTKLGEILDIPFLKLQLLCMWRDGRPFGNTRCEIYSNIVEFTFERGLKKKDLHSIPILTPRDDSFSCMKCLKENKLCRRYIDLLRKLGKLAFLALFNQTKESTLLIDRSTVAMYMNDVEVDLCLKFGLLSQSKDLSHFSRLSQKINFQHKSMQEFFAGLYVSVEWNGVRKQNAQMELMNVCKSMSDILEMNDMFLFVCGMNPQAYHTISNQLQNVADCDSSTVCFRTNICDEDHESVSHKLILYQKMQIACFIESVKHGYDNCQVSLKDLLLPFSPRQRT